MLTPGASTPVEPQDNTGDDVVDVVGKPNDMHFLRHVSNTKREDQIEDRSKHGGHGTFFGLSHTAHHEEGVHRRDGD